MSIIEKFRKAEQEDREKKIPAENKEVEGPTVKQILADHEQSRLFGMYLEENGENGLGERLMSGELSPEDLNDLSGNRQDFLKIMESVKTTRERLSARNIAEIVASSPELKKISALVGPKGIQEAVLRDLERVAIQDPEHFENIGNTINSLDESEASMKEEDKKVQAICKKYNIKESEYLEAIRSDDLNAVYNLVRGRMGKWKKIFSSKTSIDAEIDEQADRKDHIKTLSAEYDKRIGGIAEALRLTLVENKDVYNALCSDLQSQRLEKPEKDLAFSEFMNIPMKGTDVQTGWETYKKDHEKDNGFSEVQAKEDFTKEYVQKNLLKGKKGFWSIVAEAFWQSLITESLK